MPSSISSSSRHRHLAQLGCGVLAALAAIAIGSVWAPARAREADIRTHRDPPGFGSYYLAHDRGGHIDHHVLYHGIDAVARDRLRAAEVLFLGNSRLMFALEPHTLREFFARLGRRYYVLGFGHEEQDDFPLEIIRANDLRPSLVVVNADHFFAARRSEWAAKVIEETDFEAWKVQFEGEMTHRVRRAVHRLLPHYVDLTRGQREVVLYRSREDGTWFIANQFDDGVRFDWPPNDSDAPGSETLAAASAFKQQLDARGSQLVLCIVPGPSVSLHRARAVAAHLSVPLLVPSAHNLHTIDYSHLSAGSAISVAASLLEQLRPFLHSQ